MTEFETDSPVETEEDRLLPDPDNFNLFGEGDQQETNQEEPAEATTETIETTEATEATEEGADGAADGLPTPQPVGKEGREQQDPAGQPEQPPLSMGPGDPNGDLVLLDQMAEAAGMTRQEYLNQIKIEKENSAIQNRANRLVEENPALDEGAALRMAQLEHQNQKMAEQLGVFYEPMEQAKVREQAMREDLHELMKLYPNVKIFPEEVIQAIQSGGKPSVVYLQHLLKEKDLELAQLKQARQNAAKNPGSVKGDGSRDMDPFEQGFNAIW